MRAKTRQLTLQKLESDAIDAAVRFANLEIETTAQVEGLFRELDLPRQRWKTLRPGEVAAFRADQDELRGWLKSIAATGGVSRAVEKKVSERVGAIGVEGARLEFVGGRLRLVYITDVSGVQATYAYATALLLDQSRDLGERLGECPKCGQFFFDSRLRRGARMKFCSPVCSNAHRQAKWREQHSAKTARSR
jgi:hypothetical protein